MFFVRLLSRLPLSVLYVISDFLFLVSFYLVRYRRSLVKRNLRRSFPDRTSDELAEIEKSFYKNLCDYAVEMVKLVTMSREQLGARMVFRHPEVVEKLKASNQSAIFLASHQFNWEWLLVAGSACLPLPIDFVYQKVKNRFFNDLSLKVRTKFGAYPIKRDEVARELIRRKDIVRLIASVADQYPGYGRDKKFLAPFLNQETAFFLGSNQLALLTQYPVLFYKVRKIKRGYYEAIPRLISSPPYPKESTQVIEKYVRCVEEVIVENPSGWLWSHNRWKKRHLQNA